MSATVLYMSMSLDDIELERTRVVEGDGVTHLHYRVCGEGKIDSVRPVRSSSSLSA